MFSFTHESYFFFFFFFFQIIKFVEKYRNFTVKILIETVIHILKSTFIHTAMFNLNQLEAKQCSTVVTF